MELETLRTSFRARHGREPRLFSAPGRVNLIGEHTDYNDGFVLPIAIARRTFALAARRDDRKVRVRSENLAEEQEFDLERPSPPRRGGFVDYVEGTARALIERGFDLSGADLLIASDLPIGAGLSSSAALEISVGLALSSLARSGKITPTELALAGQAAEHTYVGTMCGIMDQFIAALAQADHALFIDCRTLETVPVPLSLPGAVILVCDTRAKHELASSEYNERRAECQRGIEMLRQWLPDVRALRDVSIAAFEEHEAGLPNPVRGRCRHVVTENARTLAAAHALGQNDLQEVGSLMLASHRSLRDDYEVSSPELDLAVEIAAAATGVYGARMTGGGFGGCTINLVTEEAAGSLTDSLCSGLERRFGKAPDIFATRGAAGAKEHT